MVSHHCDVDILLADGDRGTYGVLSCRVVDILLADGGLSVVIPLRAIVLSCRDVSTLQDNMCSQTLWCARLLLCS